MLEYCKLNTGSTYNVVVAVPWQCRRIRHWAFHNPSFRVIFGPDEIFDFSGVINEFQSLIGRQNLENLRFGRYVTLCQLGFPISTNCEHESKGMKGILTCWPSYFPNATCFAFAHRSMNLSPHSWLARYGCPFRGGCPNTYALNEPHGWRRTKDMSAYLMQIKIPKFQLAHRGSV